MLYDLYGLCDSERVLEYSVDVSSLQKSDGGLFSCGISMFILIVLGKKGEHSVKAISTPIETRIKYFLIMKFWPLHVCQLLKQRD